MRASTRLLTGWIAATSIALLGIACTEPSFAQTYPSPTYQTETLKAPPTIGGCTGFLYGNGASTPSTCTSFATGVPQALAAAPDASGGFTTYGGSFGTPAQIGLANATGLPLAGIATIATGLLGYAGSGTGPLASLTTLPSIVQNNIALSNLNYTSPVTGSVQRTQQGKNQDTYAVTDAGALGNSNGTTGNGHDDTSGWQAGLNHGSAYAPYGVYRTTGTLIGSSGGVYRVRGDGPGSQVYNDSASPVSTLAFLPSTPCPSVAIPCVGIDSIELLAATQTGSGSYGISAQNEQGFSLTGSNVSGQRVGLALTSSYVPTISRDTFSGNKSSAIYSADASFNGGSIELSHFYGNGLGTNDAALDMLGGTNGGLRITGIDAEGNYAGVAFNGTNEAFTLTSSYFELQTGFDLYFSGTNKACDIKGNRFGSGLTTTWSNLQQCEVSHNVFGGSGGTTTISAANDVHDNVVEGGASLVTNASVPTSCGTSPSISAMATDYSGQITTGSTATTSCSEAWAGTYINPPVCTGSVVGQTNSGFYLSPPTNTGITFNYTSATSLKIAYQCKFSN